MVGFEPRSPCVGSNLSINRTTAITNCTYELGEFFQPKFVQTPLVHLVNKYLIRLKDNIIDEQNNLPNLWTLPLVFKISQTKPLFRSFSQCKDEYNTNLTINEKSEDGVHGTQTGGGQNGRCKNPLRFGSTPMTFPFLGLLRLDNFGIFAALKQKFRVGQELSGQST